MSTCNFGRPTLSKNYTIGMERELKDYEYDDVLSNIKNELSNKIPEFIKENNRQWISGKLIIGQIPVDFYDREYLGGWSQLYIYITVESGYYQGATIDVDLSDFESYKIKKTVQAKIDRYLRKIEKVLAKNTLPLIRVGVFSNGEGVYKRA